MAGVNMVGVNNVVHDAIRECFEGIMLEPCLLQPCVHVAVITKMLYALVKNVIWPQLLIVYVNFLLKLDALFFIKAKC